MNNSFGNGKGKSWVRVISALLAMTLLLTSCNFVQGKVNISFDTDGGTKINPITVQAGDVLPDTVPVPVKEGYRFDSWVNIETQEMVGFGTTFAKDVDLLAMYSLTTESNAAKFLGFVEPIHSFTVSSAEPITEQNLKDYLLLENVDGNEVKLVVTDVSTDKGSGLYKISPDTEYGFGVYSLSIIAPTVCSFVFSGEEDISSENIKTFTFEIKQETSVIREYVKDFKIVDNSAIQSLTDTTETTNGNRKTATVVINKGHDLIEGEIYQFGDKKDTFIQTFYLVKQIQTGANSDTLLLEMPTSSEVYAKAELHVVGGYKVEDSGGIEFTQEDSTTKNTNTETSTDTSNNESLGDKMSVYGEVESDEEKVKQSMNFINTLSSNEVWELQMERIVASLKNSPTVIEQVSLLDEQLQSDFYNLTGEDLINSQKAIMYEDINSDPELSAYANELGIAFDGVTNKTMKKTAVQLEWKPDWKKVLTSSFEMGEVDWDNSYNEYGHLMRPEDEDLDIKFDRIVANVNFDSGPIKIKLGAPGGKVGAEIAFNLKLNQKEELTLFATRFLFGDDKNPDFVRTTIDVKTIFGFDFEATATLVEGMKEITQDISQEVADASASNAVEAMMKDLEDYNELMGNGSEEQLEYVNVVNVPLTPKDKGISFVGSFGDTWTFKPAFRVNLAAKLTLNLGIVYTNNSRVHNDNGVRDANGTMQYQEVTMQKKDANGNVVGKETGKAFKTTKDFNVYFVNISDEIDIQVSIVGSLGIQAGLGLTIELSFANLTWLSSIYLDLEVGAYAELTGYVKYSYNSKRVSQFGPSQTSQKLSGGLYFEAGIYIYCKLGVKCVGAKLVEINVIKLATGIAAAFTDEINQMEYIKIPLFSYGTEQETMGFTNYKQSAVISQPKIQVKDLMQFMVGDKEKKFLEESQNAPITYDEIVADLAKSRGVLQKEGEEKKEITVDPLANPLEILVLEKYMSKMSVKALSPDQYGYYIRINPSEIGQKINTDQRHRENITIDQEGNISIKNAKDLPPVLAFRVDIVYKGSDMSNKVEVRTKTIDVVYLNMEKGDPFKIVLYKLDKTTELMSVETYEGLLGLDSNRKIMEYLEKEEKGKYYLVDKKYPYLDENGNVLAAQVDVKKGMKLYLNVKEYTYPVTFTYIDPKILTKNDYSNLDKEVGALFEEKALEQMGQSTLGKSRRWFTHNSKNKIKTVTKEAEIKYLDGKTNVPVAESFKDEETGDFYEFIGWFDPKDTTMSEKTFIESKDGSLTHLINDNVIFTEGKKFANYHAVYQIKKNNDVKVDFVMIGTNPITEKEGIILQGDGMDISTANKKPYNIPREVETQVKNWLSANPNYEFVGWTGDLVNAANLYNSEISNIKLIEGNKFIADNFAMQKRGQATIEKVKLYALVKKSKQSVLIPQFGSGRMMLGYNYENISFEELNKTMEKYAPAILKSTGNNLYKLNTTPNIDHISSPINFYFPSEQYMNVAPDGAFIKNRPNNNQPLKGLYLPVYFEYLGAPKRVIISFYLNSEFVNRIYKLEGVEERAYGETNLTVQNLYNFKDYLEYFDDVEFTVPSVINKETGERPSAEMFYWKGKSGDEEIILKPGEVMTYMSGDHTSDVAVYPVWTHELTVNDLYEGESFTHTITSDKLAFTWDDIEELTPYDSKYKYNITLSADGMDDLKLDKDFKVYLIRLKEIPPLKLTLTIDKELIPIPPIIPEYRPNPPIPNPGPDPDPGPDPGEGEKVVMKIYKMDKDGDFKNAKPFKEIEGAIGEYLEGIKKFAEMKQSECVGAKWYVGNSLVDDIYMVKVEGNMKIYFFQGEGGNVAVTIYRMLNEGDVANAVLFETINGATGKHLEDIVAFNEMMNNEIFENAKWYVDGTLVERGIETMVIEGDMKIYFFK